MKGHRGSARQAFRPETANRVNRLRLSAEEDATPAGSPALPAAFSAVPATETLAHLWPAHQPLIERLERVVHSTVAEGEKSKAQLLFEFMDEQYWNNGPRHSILALLNDTKTVARRDQNKPKNRYHDILPYDAKLWELNHPALPPDFYLNASPVKIEGVNRTYVATQGPLPHTRKDFLSAIVLSGASLVVTVADPVEKNISRPIPGGITA